MTLPNQMDSKICSLQTYTITIATYETNEVKENMYKEITHGHGPIDLECEMLLITLIACAVSALCRIK